LKNPARRLVGPHERVWRWMKVHSSRRKIDRNDPARSSVFVGVGMNPIPISKRFTA